jgi:hypothetical protein
LDVLYMDLDLLDESYTIVNPKLTFEDFDLGSLTGYAIPVDCLPKAANFWCQHIQIKNVVSYLPVAP